MMAQHGRYTASAMAEGKLMLYITAYGDIYRSTDFGGSFTLAYTGSGGYKGNAWINCSDDGKYCVASRGGTSEYLYLSSDYGVTWGTTSITTGQQGYSNISGNGMYIVCANSGNLYISSNYGSSFSTSRTALGFYDIAISFDGSVIAMNSAGNIVYSKNYGSTWSTATNSIPSINEARGISITSDGTHVVFNITEYLISQFDLCDLDVSNGSITTLTTSPAGQTFYGSVYSYDRTYTYSMLYDGTNTYIITAGAPNYTTFYTGTLINYSAYIKTSKNGTYILTSISEVQKSSNNGSSFTTVSTGGSAACINKGL